MVTLDKNITRRSSIGRSKLRRLAWRYDLQTVKIVSYSLLTALVYFLVKVIKGRKRAKLKFESLAIERLNRYLSKVESESGGIKYKYFEYKRIPLNKIVWHFRDLEDIKSAIKLDCTKIGGQGVSHYAKARFSVYRDSNKRHIYFYIGSNSYKFKELKSKP